MPAYVFAEVEITTPKATASHAQCRDHEKYGGRFLHRGGAVTGWRQWPRCGG